MFNANRIFLIIFLLFLFDVFIWSFVVFDRVGDLEIYFLNVGQGDSSLVITPRKNKILIDGGPDNSVIKELSSILRPTDRYIDIVVLTHPQADHFNGLIGVLKNYEVGIFVFNGQKGTANSYESLEKVLNEKKIKSIILGEKDKIRYSSGYFDIISPSKDLLSSAEPNDSGIVMKLIEGRATALFTADIGKNIEKRLIEKYKENLDIDILKVAHHGSRYSSSDEFLGVATPFLSAIEVGRNNYGHPSPETISNINFYGSRFFRTDKDGTVKIVINGENIRVFKKN